MLFLLDINFKTTNMKILLVTGEDYGATNFANVWEGTSVSDIISNLEDYLPNFEQRNNDLLWDLEVHEFSNSLVDLEFADFIRKNYQDYDDSKHQTFYLEFETV